MVELHELSACEIVDRVRRRDVSPVDLVNALLRRTRALEPDLRAWALLDADGALQSARQIESLPRGNAGELAGLPLGIKDIFYTAGLRTAANSPLLAQHVPEEDAGAVALLRQAGAIIMGKTVTTQFADGDPADTRNPWNKERTPGGSSSGSASAVAARMVPGALGSQTAGSVLRPSAFCGIVGLKPTFGRISRRNVLPFAWSLDTVGVLARSVADAALLLQSLAGFDPKDDASARKPVDDYRGAVDRPRKPKLGLLRQFLERGQPDVREHLQTMVRRLEGAGAEVRELGSPQLPEMLSACHHVIQVTEAAEVHGLYHARSPDAYAPKLRSAVEVGHLVPGAAYIRAQRWRRRARSIVNRWLGQVDGLLLPTVSSVAPDLSTTGDTLFQAPWTMLGLPSITLPSGLNAEGLPFGIQLVGRAWNEGGLLSAASWCESVLDPMPSPV